MLTNAGPYQLPSLPSSITANPIISFLLMLNPFVLIILGVIVFFAGKLTKFVGVLIVILGLVDLLFPYLLRVA